MQNRKWLSILIALVVSLGLWVYVVTVENPEGTQTIHNIPVVFSGADILREDYDLIITDDNVASGVSVTFYGRWADLNKLVENKSSLSVTIDVTRNVRSARNYSFSYDISNVTLPSGISGSSFDVTAISPDSIDITVEELVQTPVEVKVLQEIETADGYLAGVPELDYEQINIEGPKDIVSQVSYALVTLKRENVDKTITEFLDYTLMSVDGEPVESNEITAEVTQIGITVPVTMYKDVPLTVSFIETDSATGDDVAYEIDPPSIRLSGDKSVLDAIDNIKLPNIDLYSLMKTEDTVSRTINIPDGCTNISGVSEANVKIRFPNKSIITLQIPSSNFTYPNKPDGVLVETQTTLLLVYIRANTSDIDQITAENVRVVADLSTITVPEDATSITIPVKVYVDGFDGAGVIGTQTYSITVDVSPLADEDAE